MDGNLGSLARAVDEIRGVDGVSHRLCKQLQLPSVLCLDVLKRRKYPSRLVFRGSTLKKRSAMLFSAWMKMLIDFREFSKKT